MKRTWLNAISKKRSIQMPQYNGLVNRLRRSCSNVSELSGKKPDWQTNFQVEPHHIDGRYGERLVDPFNIILITRDEHKAIHRNEYSKETLKHSVISIRVKQGFVKTEDKGGDSDRS